MEDYIQNTPYEPSKGTWIHFKRQNEIAVTRLAAANHSLDDTILDAYAVKLLRPDVHAKPGVDCLHGCHPGTMDTTNRILFHQLRRQRTKMDVANLAKSKKLTSVNTTVALTVPPNVLNRGWQDFLHFSTNGDQN